MKKKQFILLLTICLFVTLITNNSLVYASNNYANLSTKKYGWGLGRNLNHNTPSGALSQSELAQYDTYYIGNHSSKNKVIYLSFDCGYENGNTKAILDTLKKNNVKAIFFVTEAYVKSNAALIKRMKKEGHLVGNHTVHHPDLSGMSYTVIKSELLDCEKTMKQLTGYTMDKYIRPPMGCFSKRSLKICQDLGYTTILWSMAFYDYDVNNQPGKNKIISDFEKYYHNGAIVLLHVISSSDRQALQDIIDEMHGKGYSFSQFEDTQKVKIKEHSKLTLRVSNATGKISWTASNKKIHIIKCKGKKKQKMTFQANKKGNCTIYAKNGLKKHIYKIKIVK